MAMHGDAASTFSGRGIQGATGARMERTMEAKAKLKGDGGAEQCSGGQSGGRYPIGVLARQAGVSTRTVRYYEEIGLLPGARRHAGGRRVFDEDALNRLRFIGRLKALGFSLQEIRHLNEVHALHQSTGEMLGELEGLLGNHLERLEERMAELEAMRRELRAYRGRVRGRLTELR